MSSFQPYYRRSNIIYRDKAPYNDSHLKAKPVTVVIPAYNEALTIASVVDSAKQATNVGCVRVVSDGSDDETAYLARQAGADVIDLPYNRGKAGALAVGMQSLSSDYVVLLDADLVGLKPFHVDNLCKPLLVGEADMTVGVFSNGRSIIDLGQRITPNLSGQRGMSKDIALGFMRYQTAKFGIEIALTRYCRTKNARMLYVPLIGLTHVTKEEKMGVKKGLAARMKMYWQITSTAFKNDSVNRI